MFYRYMPILFAALALMSLLSQPVRADDKSHEGTVVSAAAGKLTMTMKGDDKKHTHDVAPAATISLDGKVAKLEDLKAGFHVMVKMDDKHVVTKIDAHSKSNK